MSAVGIVSISGGVLGVFYGGSFVVAPAALLRWFKGTIRTDGRTRIFGAFLLPLGAAMIWAVYRLRVLGQWFDGIRIYAAASSPTRSRRTCAGLR